MRASVVQWVRSTHVLWLNSFCASLFMGKVIMELTVWQAGRCLRTPSGRSWHVIEVQVCLSKRRRTASLADIAFMSFACSEWAIAKTQLMQYAHSTFHRLELHLPASRCVLSQRLRKSYCHSRPWQSLVYCCLAMHYSNQHHHSV